jgi:hypothetical protein
VSFNRDVSTTGGCNVDYYSGDGNSTNVQTRLSGKGDAFFNQRFGHFKVGSGSNAAEFLLHNGVKILTGSGSPESVQTAPPSSIYHDVASGDIYYKASGTGNTGWIPVVTGGDVINTAQLAHTGLVDGGVLTVDVDPAKLDVSAGFGWIVDHSDPTDSDPVKVSWSAFNAVTVPDLATATTSYVGIQDSGGGVGTLVFKAGAPFVGAELRDTIVLGFLIHTGGTVIEVPISQPTVTAVDGHMSFVDFQQQVIGPANISGNDYSANGANLQLDVSSGIPFTLGSNYVNDPTLADTPTLSAEVPIAQFFRTWRVGGDPSQIESTIASTVDPNNYDNGSGTLQAVPSNDWTVQRLFREAGAGGTAVGYGQSVYNTQTEAENAVRSGQDVFVEGDQLKAGMLRGYLIVRQSATDLSNPTQAKFLPAGSFRSAGVGGSAGSGPTTLQDAYIAGRTINVDSGNTGPLEVLHTAAFGDTSTIRVVTNASGFSDIKAVQTDYTTGAIGAGDEEGISVTVIDESASTGGNLFAKDILATDGGAQTWAVRVGAQIAPLKQLSGSFAAADTILVNAVDQTTALSPGGGGGVSIFSANSDTVTIGGTAAFEEVQILLGTVASTSITPTWEYSTGVGTWSSFSPIDGTDGFLQPGAVAWLLEDLPGWVPGTGGEYLIRITRTANPVPTTPICDEIQLAVTTEYGWDQDGQVTLSAIELPGGVTISSGSGSPEGVETAPVGSTYHRTDGGAGTSFYVKESGSGNTGWVAK